MTLPGYGEVGQIGRFWSDRRTFRFVRFTVLPDLGGASSTRAGGGRVEIAGRVHDGTLVLEGHAKVTVDEEDWELSLSGIVRPEDIMPNNTVKSEKVAEKHILRLSSGHGRDGIRRGWLQRIIDKFQPF